MRNNTSGDGRGFYVFIWFMVVIIAFSNIIFDGVDMLWKESVVEGIIGLLVMLALAVKFSATALKMMGPSLGIRKKKKPKKKKYGVLPHFENEMIEEKVMSIIEASKFSPYETRDGKILKSISVSEDQKWICILGGYLPLDLICGYDARKNELLAIDGATVKLPFKVGSTRMDRDLDAFFKDRGIYYTSLPKIADDSYFDVRRTYGLNIDREDFGKLRYQWEKAIANEKNDFWITDDNGNVCRQDMESGINASAHAVVLSDSSIQEIAESVKSGRVSLSRYLEFNDYQNEFSVCNGIEILKELGYPENAQGIDFLFMCLRDVDEAYFTYAIELLKKYPRDLVTRKIEENARHAYESEDVVSLAGVMYLAKDFEYTIEYVEELKKQKAQENSDQVGDANAIPEFEFDEAQAFGSEEVKEFEWGVLVPFSSPGGFGGQS